MKLTMRAKAKTLTKKITLISTAFVLAVSTLTAAAPFVASEQASAVGSVNITNVAELRDAITNQADGQVWTVQPGNYGLQPFNDITVQGQTGWYFPITADNLTINGVGNPTVYGSGYSPNGNWATQNLVSVFGDDVTINGFTLMPKVQPNKTVEVLGEDFALRNTTIAPNVLADPADFASVSADYKQWGGSLYFNHAGNHVVENVTIKNSGISFRYSPSGTNIAFTNVKIDHTTSVDWINAYRYSGLFESAGSSTTGTPTVTYHVNSSLNNLTSVLAGAQAGDVIELDSDITVTSQVTLNKGVTLNGNGHTISGNFVKTSNSNNSVISIQTNGVSLNNIVVDAITNANNLHAINIYQSTGVSLTVVTAKNGNYAGVNVNGSAVTAENITTSGNALYGINVDKAGAALTIKGNNSHSEAAAILVDNREVGTVNDVEGRYDIQAFGATDVYTEDITAPSISWQVQPAPLVKDTFAVRPITSEVGTLKAIYFDTISPETLCWTLNSNHKNFDTSQASCPAVFAGLADGTHKFVAVFSDANGNRTESTSNSFVLDRTGPTVTVQPSSIGSNGVYTKIGFNFFDKNKVDKIVINNVTKDLTNNNYSNLNNIGDPHWYGAIEGVNTLVAYDVAGNASAPLTFTIDRSGPSASSITSPTGWTLAADTITWSASTDANGPVTYTLLRSNTPNVAVDGVALVTDTTATSFAYTLPTGPQWLQVIAKDSVGNITAGPIQGAQVIGTPQITSPTPNLVLNATYGNSFTTKWTAVYGIGGVQSYEIRYGVDRDNSGTFEPTEYATRTVSGNTLERTQVFSTNFQGQLSVEVRAIYNIGLSPFDPNSNRGPWSTPVFYSRDTEVSLAIAASTDTTGNPTIGGTVDADVVSITAFITNADSTETPYEVVKDGSSWSIVIPEDAPLPVGTHMLTVEATDTAGNAVTRTAQIVVAQTPVEEEEETEENEKEFIETLNFLEKLGVNKVNVCELTHCLFSSEKSMFGKFKPVATNEEFEKLCTGLDKLGKIAKDRGFKLCYHHKST